VPRNKLENIGILSLDDDVFISDKKREEDNAEKVINIPINDIIDFPNHPFKVKEDDEMLDLIDSVSRVGIVSPVIVRPKDGKYEMIAGHRRKYACQKNDIKTLPCLSRNLTDDEAVIIMVDTNLKQRQHILPSEKAWAYKLKYDAMKRQGKRTDLTSGPVGQKLNSIQQISKESNDSVKQIQRFIRLTNLIDPLLDLVDENKIAMRPAVEISYLSSKEQAVLYESIQLNECTPTHDQAIRLRKLHDNDELSSDKIEEIMTEEKPNQVEKVRISKSRINKFFSPKTSAKEMEDEIIKALEFYQRYKNRKRDREAR
jgi:ParB family chromosome partitioning protein